MRDAGKRPVKMFNVFVCARERAQRRDDVEGPSVWQPKGALSCLRVRARKTATAEMHEAQESLDPHADARRMMDGMMTIEHVSSTVTPTPPSPPAELYMSIGTLAPTDSGSTHKQKRGKNLP